MSFQDDLLRNMCTKDEAKAKQKEEMQAYAVKVANVIYNGIKEKLIMLSAQGNYQISNGKKTVSCLVLFPPFCQHYLQINDKSITILGTPTYLERQLQELLQTPSSKRKAVLRKYRGIDLTSGGTPAKLLPCAQFDLDTNPESECGCIIDKLQQFAEQDNVQIQLCVKDEYANVTYPFCEDINGASAERYKYSIAVKCSTIIPETYSTDIPVTLAVKTAESIENTINIDSMKGHQFEQFCAQLLVKNGFSNVYVTKGSGDQGIDIIAYKDGVKFGIQCKCYSTDIGNKAVQEAYAGKTYYNCHVGAVLTNRYFTHSAIDLSNSNGILLWDRGYLIDMMNKSGIKING